MTELNEYATAELDEIHSLVWTLLADGVNQGKHAFHTPVLATTGPEGPETRTVVLRYVDPEEGIIQCHTDRRSPKVLQLNTHPRVSWLFYDAVSKIQIRAYGRTFLHWDDEIARKAWEGSRLSSRQCYRHEHPPGIGMESGGAPPQLLDADGFDNFTVVRCVLDRLDWLYLKYDGHKRCILLKAPEGAWQSRWVAP